MTMKQRQDTTLPGDAAPMTVECNKQGSPSDFVSDAKRGLTTTAQTVTYQNAEIGTKKMNDQPVKNLFIDSSDFSHKQDYSDNKEGQVSEFTLDQNNGERILGKRTNRGYNPKYDAQQFLTK